MFETVTVALLFAVIGAVVGWALGRRREDPGEPHDPYQAPLQRFAAGLAEGRIPSGGPGDPPALAELRESLSAGWTPQDSDRGEALKQALGRIAAFLEESVEAPLLKVRNGDRELLAEGVDRALGGLKDLEFFLREPITPDETHNLVPLVQQVTREFIEDSEVAVRLQAPTFPVRAHIHKDTFLDAVYLLLHNAGHFGGGERIDVRVEQEGDHAVVSILDQGPGFSPEAMERARELFYTTKPTALGLGIPFARKIIEGFGGNLEISNRPEGGAAVRLVLPGDG
ncbi:MAG: HAMP domain-containing sensor histidine kinase [Gemmatimonadota bacterium]